jgi:LCP family protein required for cell wall assembly
MNMEHSRSRSSLPQWFWSALGFAFVGTLVFAGYMVYARVRDYVAGQQMVVLNEQSGITPLTTAEPNATALPEIPRWDGHERINVLVLGIDERNGEEGPWRTDTMLILTLDPVTMSAGMLSIPRDLWVTIPGYDQQNRINTAHYFGDLYDYPGGGPALARDTVAWNLGVPIDYYVRVNFTAFETLIDEIDGIDLDIPETIDDPNYPDEAYGYDPFYIEAGEQHLDGKMALKYARTRATFGGDFDRGRRQQQVILAVRDRVVKLNQLPRLVAKAPALMETLGDAVQSDLSLDQAIRLARLASEIDPEGVVTGVLDQNYTSAMETPEGWQVLVVNREALRELRALLFAEPLVLKDTGAVAERLNAESARIAVLNGSTVAGLATMTADYLAVRDFQVVTVGDADVSYESTLIVDNTGKHYTSRQLAILLHLPLSSVVVGGGLEEEYDIALILGNDFQLPEGQ